MASKKRQITSGYILAFIGIACLIGYNSNIWWGFGAFMVLMYVGVQGRFLR